MTQKQIDKEIKRFEKNLDEKGLWAYRLLITFVEVGPFLKREDIDEKVLGYWDGNKKPRFLKTMITRAVNNRIVRYGPKKQTRFLDGEIYEDSIGLALGSCILHGYIKRVKKD